MSNTGYQSSLAILIITNIFGYIMFLILLSVDEQKINFFFSNRFFPEKIEKEANEGCATIRANNRKTHDVFAKSSLMLIFSLVEESFLDFFMANKVMINGAGFAASKQLTDKRPGKKERVVD